MGKTFKIDEGRWWGLKLNGELLMVLSSDRKMTVSDFRNSDVPIPDGKLKVVELLIREKK